MNTHHYELFYYVVKYRGITNAAPKIPYGIQTPAISKQMKAFEEDLGHRLFTRKPFRLTPEGQRVAAKANEWIGGMLELTAQLKQGTQKLWRVCASEWMLQNQISGLIQFLHRQDVKTTFRLTPAGPSLMEQWLVEDRVDLAFGPLNEKLPAALESEAVAEIPLALFVPKGRQHARIRSAEYFWSRSPIPEPLVCPSPDELLGRMFLQELERRAIRWPLYIDYGSIAPVIQYVADGHGIGLAPNFPPLVRRFAVRAIPLDDFPKFRVGAMWQKAAGRPRISLEIIRRMAREVCPELLVEGRNNNRP